MNHTFTDKEVTLIILSPPRGHCAKCTSECMVDDRQIWSKVNVCTSCPPAQNGTVNTRAFIHVNVCPLCVCVCVYVSDLCPVCPDAVRYHCWPLHAEVELVSSLLDFVLGITVQHVHSRLTLNGQDQVSRTQIGHGRLAARSNLRERGRESEGVRWDRVEGMEKDWSEVGEGEK